MEKMKMKFEDFLAAVGPEHEAFVSEMHSFLLKHGCACAVTQAKLGCVVSYKHPADSKAIMNCVFRKKGPMMRVYADNIAQYERLLETWPEWMKDSAKSAGDCKRLLDPTRCSPTCRTGFDYMLDGARYQKCRNSGFMYFLSEETKPLLRGLVESETACREAAK